MINTRMAIRTTGVVAAALLLAFGASPDALVEAQSQGNGLTGTWFVSLPGGLTGFYTYQQDGTMTGATSTMFGAPPQAPGFFSKQGPDHGVWRQVGGGFELVIYRMTYDSMSGDPLTILRTRTYIEFNPDRDTLVGTWIGDLWFCPDALSCPDPNKTPPDLADLAPPPPLNTWTQTRVRLP